MSLARPFADDHQALFALDARHGILRAVAIAAVNLNHVEAHLFGCFGGEDFRHRGFLGASLAIAFQPRRFVDEQTRYFDLS